MEILKQKAERTQLKKEADILKEIEEKIRKEIKAHATGETLNTGENRNSNFINAPNLEEPVLNEGRLSLNQDILSINQSRLASFNAE